MTTLLAVSRRRTDNPGGGLQSIPDLLANWDATRLTGLTDADPVTSWPDAAGTADAVTAGGFGQPTYRTNQRGSLPAVRFTRASSQVLAIDAIGTALAGTQPFTAFIVQRPSTTDGSLSPLVLESSVSVNPVHHIYVGTLTGFSEHSTVRRNAAGTNKARSNTPKAVVPRNRWAITASRFNGTTETAWVNGALKSTNHDLDVGALAVDRASIGGWRRPNIQFYDGELGHIVIYNRALTDDEVHDVGAILAAKWDLSWGPYNAPAPLPIPTSNEGGAIHPDVLDFGDAPFAGYRYWMAMTPYDGTEPSETPSVVVTNDLTGGGTWTVPTGYTNPVNGATLPEYNADTDIVYDADTGRLWVFYVASNGTSYLDLRGKWTTGDGVWSSEVTAVSMPLSALLNPSIVKTSTGWRVYYNDSRVNPRRLIYRDTTEGPGSGYGDEVVCDLGLFSNRRPQNINMVRDEDGTLVCVVSDSPSNSSIQGSLLFSRATNDGTTFVRAGPTVIDTPLTAAWDDSTIYRASIVTGPDSVVVVTDGEVDCYYSARAADGTWGTAWARLPVSVLGH